MTQSENELLAFTEGSDAAPSNEGMITITPDAAPAEGQSAPATEAEPADEPRVRTRQQRVSQDDEVEADDESSVDDDAQSDAEGTESDDESDDDDDTPGPGQPGAKRAALENEGEIAADYLEELLDIADLDGDIDTFVEAGRPRVSILTDGDLLVGRNGEVLEALQELARLAVMTETGKRSRLMLDIAGHRDKRRRELQALAQDAVTEVKESGESVRLAPMNPFERKIVHDVVAQAGLVSESEGQEPQRRVVVLPA